MSYERASAADVRARRAETGRGMSECQAEINRDRREAWLSESIEAFRRDGDRDVLCDVLIELARPAPTGR